MAPGGVVQVSLGDSYAGEPVPRWRLACVYRRDGAPLWRNLPVAACGDATATGPDAARFGSALASVLGVAAEDVVPAWDDPLPRLLRDGGSAIAIAPPPELLHDPVRRRELADRLSAQGCGAPAGWVLPLAWDAASERWRSERWRFRRDRLYLLEGTLPVGLRLPLEGLPATTRGTADRPTALCLEVRDGHLHVFLPPTDSGLRWGELVAAVDAAAARHPVPLVLEGYEPPDDAPGLARFILEPDAGVLRVCVPAVAGFAAQTDLLHSVHAEAAVLGLHPERRTASGESEPIGAGTAIVLEGTTPDESPLLRRPEDPARTRGPLAAPPLPIVFLRDALRWPERSGAASRRGT